MLQEPQLKPSRIYILLYSSDGKKMNFVNVHSDDRQIQTQALSKKYFLMIYDHLGEVQILYLSPETR